MLQQAKAAALKSKVISSAGVLDVIGAALAKTGALAEAIDTANRATGFDSAALRAGVAVLVQLVNLGFGGFGAGVEEVEVAALLGLGDVGGVQGAEAAFVMT
jgi:hypothetical protein